MECSGLSAQPSTTSVRHVLTPEHIDKIVFYLRAAENFRKYNKFVYAFRLEESKPVFLTENAKNNSQYI